MSLHACVRSFIFHAPNNLNTNAVFTESCSPVQYLLLPFLLFLLLFLIQIVYDKIMNRLGLFPSLQTLYTMGRVQLAVTALLCVTATFSSVAGIGLVITLKQAVKTMHHTIMVKNETP